MAKLSVSGLSLNLTTILGIIKDVASAAELAAPGFKTLLEAAMSVFSTSDQETIEKAYQDRMNQTDLDHAATQDELQKEADKGLPPTGSESGEAQDTAVKD